MSFKEGIRKKCSNKKDAKNDADVEYKKRKKKEAEERRWQ